MNRKKLNGGPDQKHYRSIREVSLLLEVKPHVLRYWETQFSGLRPRKNRAGNRIYRPEEIDLVARIKDLLYGKRFTIEGARRLLADEKRKGVGGAPRGAPSSNGAGAATATPDKPPAPVAVAASRMPGPTAAWLQERAALVRDVRQELLRLARDLREGGEARSSSPRARHDATSLASEPISVAAAAETDAVPAGAGFER